jgi:hypothetical protein
LEKIIEGIEEAGRCCEAHFADWRRQDQLREEERKREEEERSRVETLSKHLVGWREARDIRAFVADVRQRATGEGRTIDAGEEDSLAWALSYANAVDPALQPFVLFPVDRD